MLNPIQTQYKGYLFRSRLEARWAVFLDVINEPWEYEKEGYKVSWFGEKEEYYLPDFWLPRFEAFLEIKGKEPTASECNLCRGLMSDKYPVILANGIPGENFLKVFICEMCESSGGFIEVDGKFCLHKEKDQIVIVLDRLNSSCVFCTSDWEPLDRFWNNYDLRGTILEESKIINRAVKSAKQSRFEHGKTI